MTSTQVLINELIEDLFKDSSFILIKDLVKFKIFGTSISAVAAISRGELECIRISRNRRLIPKQSVITFLEKRIKKENRLEEVDSVEP